MDVRGFCPNKIQKHTRSRMIMTVRSCIRCFTNRTALAGRHNDRSQGQPFEDCLKMALHVVVVLVTNLPPEPKYSIAVRGLMIATGNVHVVRVQQLHAEQQDASLNAEGAAIHQIPVEQVPSQHHHHHNHHHCDPIALSSANIKSARAEGVRTHCTVHTYH